VRRAFLVVCLEIHEDFFCFVLFCFVLDFDFLLLFSQATALHWSSYHNHLEACKLLIASKSDVNAKDSVCEPSTPPIPLNSTPPIPLNSTPPIPLNSTPPIFFDFYQRLSEADVTLRWASCNLRRLFSGCTALHASSRNGHLEVCKLLIASKSDVNAKNS
jgi:hypothetical protein